MNKTTQYFFGKLSLLIFNSLITDSKYPAHIVAGVHTLSYGLYLGPCALNYEAFPSLPKQKKQSLPTLAPTQDSST